MHRRVLALGFLALSSFALVPVTAQTRVEFVPTFSTSPRVEQQWQRLQALATQKSWDAWVTTYQQLVDDTRDLVLPRGPELMTGLRGQAHQLLASLPAAARERYRALKDEEAAVLLQQAQDQKDPALALEVYQRFRLTGSGPKALAWIARTHLAEGRTDWARTAYARLVRDTRPTAAQLTEQALAAAASGQTSELREVVRKLQTDFPGVSLKVGGRAVSAADLEKTLAIAQKAAPEAPRWDRFGGAGDRAMASGATVDPRKLWHYEIPTVTDTSSYRSSRVLFSANSSSSRGRFSFVSYPAVQGSTVVVQGPRSLTALDLANGQKRWEINGFPLLADEVPEERPEPRGSYYYRANRSGQAAPSIVGHQVITRVHLAPPVNSSALWPVDLALASYDARTGAQLWRRIAGGSPRGAFYNIPLVSGGVVYTGVATYKGGITEYSAVAMDAGTGETLWTTYLGAGSEALHLNDGSPALLRDGTVWIETAMHTLAALDMLTGEVKQIYRYAPARRYGSRGGSDSSPPVANEPISLIAAPSGPIVFVPRWGSEAVAFDPNSLKPIWRTPKSVRGSYVGALFAVDSRRAYITGDMIRAVNLTDGSPAWTWEPEAGFGDLGFAALVNDQIWVLLDGKLQVRAAADGAARPGVNLSAVVSDTPGFTSLIVVDHTALLTTGEKIFAFGVR